MIPLYEVVSKVVKPGDSLPVQWLGLHTLIVEGLCSIPGGELKSHQVHELHTMVKRFLSEYNDIHFDAVTFVPVSKAKLHSKGFDHAELLAKAVAQALNLKLVSPPFKRKKKPAQKYLSMLLRSKNADGSFMLKGNSVSGNILLIDDVITTGSTLSVCSELLKKAGANKVYCLTAATSSLKN